MAEKTENQYAGRDVIGEVIAEDNARSIPPALAEFAVQSVAELQEIIAQRDVRIEDLDAERADQWRLRREAEADRDTKAAVIAELKNQLAALKARAVPPSVAQHALEAVPELKARIEELEAHCLRLGQGGAERYWENRWREADAELAALKARQSGAVAQKVWPEGDYGPTIEETGTQPIPVGAKLYLAPVSAGESFQSRVLPWLLECFGAAIANDTVERNHRFLEEALELVQACGCHADEAHKLVDYVYGRPDGEKSQEVGGVMVTLAALCLAQGLDMRLAGETELARINQPVMVERIREKQKRKPAMSPLPGVYPDRAALTAAAPNHGEQVREVVKELSALAIELDDRSESAWIAYKLNGEQSAELSDQAECYAARAKHLRKLAEGLAAPSAQQKEGE